MGSEDGPRRPPDRPTAATGEELEFDPASILFHGEGLLAVDKPADLPVHAGSGHARGLVEQIRAWISLEPGVIDVSARRGLHPLTLLDKESSGVVVLGMSRKVTRVVKPLVPEFRRRFVAVVAGPLPEAGRLAGRVRDKTGGRPRLLPAEIEYRRLAGDERASLVEVIPHTHRKHQIRVLFARRGRPLAGDILYGKPGPVKKFQERFGIERLLLHLFELKMPGPESGRELTFRAPMPDAFQRFCEAKGWTLAELD